MKVIDQGHHYDLAIYDEDDRTTQHLLFMKREGPGYPFNVGHHAGTNCQEVIRALIDRVKYLERQIECPENAVILAGLRSALLAFEIRAARRHGRELPGLPIEVENMPTCDVCGHIGCASERHPSHAF